MKVLSTKYFNGFKYRVFNYIDMKEKKIIQFGQFSALQTFRDLGAFVLYLSKLYFGHTAHSKLLQRPSSTFKELFGVIPHF